MKYGIVELHDDYDFDTPISYKELVLCKECRWRDTDNQGEDYCMYVKGLCDINESSFCSWGERKESE